MLIQPDDAIYLRMNNNRSLGMNLNVIKLKHKV